MTAENFQPSSSYNVYRGQQWKTSALRMRWTHRVRTRGETTRQHWLEGRYRHQRSSNQLTPVGEGRLASAAVPRTPGRIDGIAGGLDRRRVEEGSLDLLLLHETEHVRQDGRMHRQT